MPRQRTSERSRSDILLAAEYEFSDKGFYGARIDEIARRAGINKRMIYAYFGNKETLYKHVLAHVYARMAQVEQTIVDADYSGEELIRHIISAYFDFLRDNPSFVNLLMWENLNKGRFLKEIENSKIQRATIGIFLKELQKGKEDGSFRADIDEWQTVISLITMCFANFSNQYTLSRLFSTDLSSAEAVEQRKQHTTEIILAYLQGRK